MAILDTQITPDAIIQMAALVGATVTFVIAQSVQKAKDRKLANREVYQQLELASIDLFRFEAENVDLIRPVWEKGKAIPSKGTAEYVVCVNYVCQILNLFEIALRFRKDKIFLADAFTTWISWFQILVTAPGFPKVWKDIRFDYLPDLRNIMDGGIVIIGQETDDMKIRCQFYHHVANVLDCKVIREWANLIEEENKISTN